MQEKQIIIQPSTIETIDFAVFNWLNDKMNLHCETNEGWKKVEVLWVGGERAAQIKENPDRRDFEGSLILPLVSVERKSFEKDPTFKGVVQMHLPRTNDYKGGTLDIGRIINQDKTSNFANNQSFRQNIPGVGYGQLNFKYKKKKPPVYTTYTAPLPTYVKVMYEISLRSEFQQQMNQLLQPFIVKTGHITSFSIRHENHRFELFFEPSFPHSNNISEFTDVQRNFETKFNVKVLGYLMGADSNDNQPKITLRENIVEFKIMRESTILKK